MRLPRDVLEHELAGEAANALGHAGQKLERALAALRTFDAASAATSVAAPSLRAELVADAAERLWVYVIQREAMGLFRHDRVLDLLQVPQDVRRRIGPRRRTQKAG